MAGSPNYNLFAGEHMMKKASFSVESELTKSKWILLVCRPGERRKKR